MPKEKVLVYRENQAGNGRYMTSVVIALQQSIKLKQVAKAFLKSAEEA